MVTWAGGSRHTASASEPLPHPNPKSQPATPPQFASRIQRVMYMLTVTGKLCGGQDSPFAQGGADGDDAGVVQLRAAQVGSIEYIRVRG